MTSSPSFFKSPQKKSMENITNTPSNIHIDNRADFATAIWLIDYLRTTTHQKNKCIPGVILEPLLHKLQENTAYEKTSVGYLTPIKYLKQLCLETDPNILVPALADVLNQQALEYVLKTPRAYTSYFLDTTPHTLSQKNIKRNVRCLNPVLPSIISRLLELPFHISTTCDNKTLPKKHPNSSPILNSSTGIKLHWQNGHCLVLANIIDIAYFKSLDKTKFPPTAALHLNKIEQLLEYISQETTRSLETYHSTQNQLTKYMATEKRPHSDLLKIYFEYLNRSVTQPSKYFDTLHGTQDFFQNTTVSGMSNGLKGAITRLLTLGEQLDLATDPIETYDSIHTAPAA